MTNFQTLLCDIEGTVTSISFVQNELFPYAFNKVREFLETHNQRPDVNAVLLELIVTVTEESEHDENIKFIPPDRLIEGMSEYVRYWINHDKKLPALKKLQGIMWEDGYKAGDYKGHVFPEVLDYWKGITEQGKKIYIYSSGSVQAQKLLFEYSVNGDMTEYISGYFDTTTGHKREAESYRKIATKIGGNAGDILFLTDIEAEARAAKEAGLQVILVEREGNEHLSEEAKKDFRVITSLDDI